MERPKILSGEALVAHGITKIDASLPEVGLKDVTPNGSWLEQKQVQAALEARKHLIEVERIEKCGTLSHAEWCDDLQLAEVTQKSGGYWQYLGHNVGKTLFLRPEEALFLMEVNSLLLKHNEVTVSLQKAYSLLLHSSTTLTQYRVYASLSRLGYKVFRHKDPNVSSKKNSYYQKNNTLNESENIDSPNISDNVDSPEVKTENESVDDAVNIAKEIGSAKFGTPNEPENVDSIIITNTIRSKNDCGPLKSESKELDKKAEVVDGEKNISELNENFKEVKQEKLDEVISANIDPPVVMELDGSVKSQKSDGLSQSQSETHVITEVSSTDSYCNPATDNNNINKVKDNPIHNTDNDTNMEICTETHEALRSGTPNILPKDLTNVGDSNNLDTSTAIDDPILKMFNQKFYYSEYNNLSKIHKISHRQFKPCDSKTLQKHFDNIPDIYKKEVVTINVPGQELIPKNIYVNKSCYLLDLKNIKRRSIRSASTESPAYTSFDEVNGTNIRRIRSSSGPEIPHNPNFFPQTRFPRHPYFRPDSFWRPQNNLNYFQFNMFFNRPNFSNMFFQSRFQYLPRSSPVRLFPYQSNFNPNIGYDTLKRLRNGRTTHLQNIKNLAVRLKQIVMASNTELRNIESLQSLLHSYNMRYKSRLRLTETFDIVNEEKIVETIELDDDEESRSKKPRLEEDDSDKFDENLNRLRQLALKLRDLETKGKASGSHRRAFSKAIKTFNKSYNADIYLNEDTYEVIDKRFITLESSSESDCIVEEKPKNRKTKKLRNPFNILKRRSERLKSMNNPGTSKDENALHTTKIEPDDSKYSKVILETFDKSWLPNENDFGRAEVVPMHFMNARLIDSGKEQYLYDFMNDQCQQYENWIEAKISFLRHLEEPNIAFQNEQARFLSNADISNIGLRPLIDSDDSSDFRSVLEKLRIIKNNKDIDTDTSLSIHFDVYHRDVQNFKKTNPPRPHFRVICVEESSSFPSAASVMALHSKYDDNVAIVFAIVSIGSVSYIQINPTDLPVCVPKNDIE